MTEKDFLDELRIQFDRLLKTKSNLDSKATGMITMSGLVSTLLMGFGTLLLRSIKPDFQYFNCIFWVLLGGISLMIITIILSVLAYKSRDQWYPLGSDKFYKNNNYEKDDIDSYRKKDEFYNLRMIKDYIFSINDAEKIIDNKGSWIKRSQWAFLIGIGSIPFIIVLVIMAINVGKLTGQL